MSGVWSATPMHSTYNPRDWPMSKEGFDAILEFVNEWALDPRFKHLVDQTPRDLDAGITRNVLILAAGGVETFESCQGGVGHCFPEPTIRFFGNQAAGFHALSIAHNFALGATQLSRVWNILDGEPVGPQWEISFRPPVSS